MSPSEIAGFPHPVYAEHVLGPQFEEGKRYIFDDMLDANLAHAIMLQECDVIDPACAAGLIRAIEHVRDMGVDAFAYDPKTEDLFFAVEGKIIEIAGPDIGGNLQIARSRNDLAAALGRIVFRRRIAQARGLVLKLHKALEIVVAKHHESLMPGITHTQPAQPTTLAHHLLGLVESLERDAERLDAAWHRANQSPLGIAAFTTTSFPIDRQRSADLLGFDTVLVNGYDAVGAHDYMLESTHALVNCVTTVSRFVYDLLVWSRKDVGYLRIADPFIQISSIMPQKRNPVVLEHVRTRIAWVIGGSHAVETMVHSAAYGDTNDVEDPIHVPLHDAFNAFTRVMELLTSVVETATFNTVRMASLADEGFATATALADMLVQHYGVSFRTAHRIVSHVVNRALAEGGDITTDMVNEEAHRVVDERITISDAHVQHALDPVAFVAARALPGGPAPMATRRELETSCQRRVSLQSELDADERKVADAIAQLRERARSLCEQS